MQGCQRETSGWPPGNVISVACHLGEVYPPSLVQLGKPFQALVTICNLDTLLNGAGGVVACLTSQHETNGVPPRQAQASLGKVSDLVHGAGLLASYLGCQAQVE